VDKFHVNIYNDQENFVITTINVGEICDKKQ